MHVYKGVAHEFYQFDLFKVLVFSQSLLSLDLIEDFLAREHENQEKLLRKNEAAPGAIGTWIFGKDYYR